MILHSCVIVFNLFGWIWIKSRKANLILLLLTGASWFVLGIWKGIGYCPLTDWHYNVLYELGYRNLPDSYVKFFIDRITGWDVNAARMDWITSTSFFLALGISLYLNLKRKKAILS
jgi:hypothetical protein